MYKQPLISINVSLGRYQDFIDNVLTLTDNSGVSEYVCVANAHMLVEAHKYEPFQSVVNNSIITTPDGVSLVWGLNFLHNIRQDRVAGMDLLPDLLAAASTYHKRVFFYGSTDTLLEKVRQHIAVNYPEITAVGVYSPPFRALTEQEEQEIVARINESNPDLIFVALGCPKQEKWMASMHGRVNGVMLGIGAALPVLVGEQSRAPKWMQRMGAEWVYRFCQEPARLWKRYLTTNTIYVFLVLKEKIKKLFNPYRLRQ
jgi:N-acetylglucosaminyldiphosphoundecaprenol N-acetyl-beta-D-mannosaminyltransferase